MSKTLADMTSEGREQCRGMWCDYRTVNGEVIEVIYRWEKDGLASVHDPKALDERTNQYVMVRRLVPRFDLPRAWSSSGAPVPATLEVDHRIVPADHNGGIYQTRRWTRHVTEWKPDE